MGGNVFLHDAAQQQEVIDELELTVMDQFISKLGNESWSLGYLRNYSLILSFLLGFNKIMWLDDDIHADSDIVVDIFNSLNQYPFVSTNVTLMPDTSIIGHIKRFIEIDGRDFPISGGCMGICLDSVSEYCLNYYNEDWIWVGLQKPRHKIKTVGKVDQEPFDPFDVSLHEVFWQEFGEVLEYGVINCDEINTLRSDQYWRDVLAKMERDRWASLIRFLTSDNDCPDNSKLFLQSAMLFNRYTDFKSFSQVFNTYFENRPEWEICINRCKRFDMGNNGIFY